MKQQLYNAPVTGVMQLEASYSVLWGGGGSAMPEPAPIRKW